MPLTEDDKTWIKEQLEQVGKLLWREGMTVEERLDRIEHLSVGWLEERRGDHEEYVRRWRDTQEQIDATWKAIQRLAEESRAATVESRTVLEAMRVEADRRDQKTDERIHVLVSAIGDLIRAMSQQK